MASTEATERGLILKQKLRLAALLREIEELQAELADLDRRVVEVDGRRIEGEVAPLTPVGAEELAQRVAKEVLRRGRAEIRVSLEQAETDASAMFARARDRARDVRGVNGSFTFAARAPGSAGRTNGAHGAAAAPPVARHEQAVDVEEQSSESEAAAPGRWRRWAHPAEILLHLVILFLLIAVALSVFR